MEVVEVNWLECDHGKLLHLLRESTRLEQWSILHYRRPTFQGTENSIDRKASLELYKMVSGLPRYNLRCIMTGALRTNSRKNKMCSEEDPCCPNCPGVKEDTEHVFCNCPHYERLRKTEITDEEWDMLPKCTKLHGLVPLLDAGLPERFQGEMGRKELGCLIQHNLLDIWDQRMVQAGETGPAPRWEAGN